MHPKYLLVGFTSCQMMSSWRFCPKPKIPLQFSHTCVNASRILHRFALAHYYILRQHVQNVAKVVK